MNVTNKAYRDLENEVFHGLHDQFPPTYTVAVQVGSSLGNGKYYTTAEYYLL